MSTGQFTTEKHSIGMGGEVYQAQVLRNFFDTITGTDRNLTRIYMCVMSLAKLRMEPPEKMTSSWISSASPSRSGNSQSISSTICATRPATSNLPWSRPHSV